MNENKLLSLLFNNESNERFSLYGLKSLLFLFLRTEAKQSYIVSLSIVHCFVALNYSLSITVGIITEIIFGKYNTIINLTIIFLIGIIHLIISTINEHTIKILIFGLFLISIGMGGLKSCVSFTNNYKVIISLKQKIIWFILRTIIFLSNIWAPILASIRCNGKKTCYVLPLSISTLILILSFFLILIDLKRHNENNKKYTTYKKILFKWIKKQINKLNQIKNTIKNENKSTNKYFEKETKEIKIIKENLEENIQSLKNNCKFNFKKYICYLLSLNSINCNVIHIPNNYKNNNFDSNFTFYNYENNNCNFNHTNENFNYNIDTFNYSNNITNDNSNLTNTNSNLVKYNTNTNLTNTNSNLVKYNINSNLVKYNTNFCCFEKKKFKIIFEKSSNKIEIQKISDLLKFFVPLVIFWLLVEQQYTNWVEQSLKMQSSIIIEILKVFKNLSWINNLIILFLISLFSCIIYCIFICLRLKIVYSLKYTVIALGLATTAFFISAIVEFRIYWQKQPMSILWQLPQYIILFIAELVMETNGVLIHYKKTTFSTRNLIIYMWLLTIGIGNFIIVPISVVFSHFDFLQKTGQMYMYFLFGILGIFATINISNVMKIIK